MKRFTTILFFSLIAVLSFSQSGTLSINQYFSAGTYNWELNINEAKAVKVDYQIDILPGVDNVVFYDINSSGGNSYSGVAPTGFCSGSYITTTKTGKVLIMLSCVTSGNKKFELKYYADNPIESKSDLKIGGNGYIAGNLGVGVTSALQKLHVNGNSYITGNLGLGVSNPQEKLHVNGAIRGNGPGQSLNIRTSYGNIEVGAQNQFYAHIYTDRDQFIFNKRVNLYNGVLTSYVGTNLNFQTGGGTTEGTTRMTILNSNGNVGVGTTNPKAKFDVGAFIDNEQLGTVLGRLAEGNTTGTGTFLGVKGYGTQSYNYNGKGFAIEHNFYGVTNSSINFFRGSGMSGGFISFNTNDNSEKMRINTNGNVSIGTIDPDPTGALLTVKGKIHAQEVLIDLNSPLADYVFSPEYKLMPLFEVEKFVKTNRHLPEIPSAADVKENSLSMGEMQNKLLQKIEELTLYVIEQQKRIEQLEKNQK
jgi:hypothetical protein